MIPSSRSHWCTAAVFLHCCSLLRLNVWARPFVLLSGTDALPDDDIDPPVYIVSGTARAFSSERPPPITVAASVRPMLEAAIPRQDKVTAASRLRQAAGWSAYSKLASNPRSAQPTYVRMFKHGALPVPTLKCRDVRKEIVVESGFQGYADVFSDGRAAASWAFGSSSSPPSSNFVMPTEEQIGVFVVHTARGVSLQAAKVSVSDSSMLGVDFSEKQGDKAESGAVDNASVFLSRHVCRKTGIAMVTIELPLRKDRASPSGTSCSGQPEPVVFAYRKACVAPLSAFGTFMKALSAEVSERDKTVVLAHGTVPKAPDAPWKGIIPTGGGRMVLATVLILLFLIVIYEFGSHWLSNKMKNVIVQNSVHFFGIDTTIEYTSVSFWMGHFTYTLRGLQMKNPSDGAFNSPYFMAIDEVKVWFNFQRLLMTCGNDIEIKVLHARHVKANIEVDGYIFGRSNITAVQERMEENNKQWIQDLADIKEKHGIDAAKMWSDFEAKMLEVSERVILKEVEIEGISYSMANKSLGMEMKIADMEFHDFSEQHDAVGMKRIGYCLTHAVLEGMAGDIAGVEFGHGHFEGLINNVKRLSSFGGGAQT